VSIRRNNRRDVRIAVIGGGFGGIAAAVYLQRAGFTNFTVFEQSDGPGGVWWDNRYPGAEVDTPTHTYSFSFQRYDWTRSHADQQELQGYMEHTLDQWNLRRYFTFGVHVDGVGWDDARHVWQLHVGPDILEFHVVVSAVGILNVPRKPTWPGLDDFTGVKFHTSRWPAGLDLSGKRVAVVGTGSTAAQVVPRVAAAAEHLYVFQREPGWINPKPVKVFTAAERAALRNPRRYRLERIRGYRASTASRAGGDIHLPDSAANKEATQRCIAYINEVFKDRPDLQKSVTPTYGYFGKRPIKDSNFYPALLRDDVELIPHPVVRVTPTGIVDDTGTEHQIDVLVMATGFQGSNYLAQLPVTGPGGRTLHEAWNGEPEAFLGITVPGFPNFFMLYGPNTNSPVVLFHLEQQSQYVVRALKRMLAHGATAVESRRPVHDRYNRWLQGRMKGSVWETTNNYFRTPSGKVVTQWPVSPSIYWVLARLPMAVSTRLRSSASADLRRTH
jgi:cation diffusion facilitator CzcD-associated flavoprotein CzcO